MLYSFPFYRRRHWCAEKSRCSLALLLKAELGYRPGSRVRNDGCSYCTGINGNDKLFFYSWSLFLVEGAYSRDLIKPGESPYCLNSWGKRDIKKKSVGGRGCRSGIYSPLHLLPGTSIHLMAANRLQAELLGENDQLWQQWPINWVWVNGKCIRITWESFKLWTSGVDFISDSESCLPAQWSLDAPTVKNGPQDCHWLRNIQVFI